MAEIGVEVNFGSVMVIAAVDVEVFFSGNAIAD